MESAIDPKYLKLKAAALGFDGYDRSIREMLHARTIIARMILEVDEHSPSYELWMEYFDFYSNKLKELLAL